MYDRLEEFTDALTWIDAAYKVLSAGDCPFDVAAHLDFAARRLADHVNAIGGATINVGSQRGHWLN
jgi:hypothetical protein